VAHVIAQVKTATDAIAHDLRTPLTRVRAALGRLRDGSLPAESAAAISRAVADLDAVIDRFAALLRLSELEAAGRRAGLSPVALAPLLAELAAMWEPIAEERCIALRLEVVDVPPVEADRELMAEAIGNLIDNAIKYARAAVTIRLLPAAVEVLDDGPGVPPEEREAVLRRFHRSRGAAGVEGTGLGLAVVSAILRLHGFALTLADAGPGLVARIDLTQM
jgi:signal transduction histidine kinase